MKTYLKFLCLLPLLAIFIVSLEKESKAWTFEDFLDYVQFTYDNNINSSNTTINNYRNWIVSHKQDLYTQLQNLNINVDNYNNFIIYNGYASHRVEIYMYYGTPTYTCSSSGVYINPTISCLDFHWATAGNNAQYDTKSTPNGSRDYLGLIDSNPTNGDYYNVKIQNVWNYYVLRNGVYTVDNLPWELADVKIANAYNQENIIFTLYDINDNEVKTLSYARQNDQTLGGYLYLLYIDNTIGLIDGETYYFKANNGSDILRSENFILNWSGGSSIIPSGTITNQSGDVTGNIDLSGIENGISNLANTVNSGDQQIINAIKEKESGDKERDSFWKKAYEELFTLDSGDVERLYETLSGEVLSQLKDKSEYTEELEILEKLRDTEPGDLILKWDTIEYLDRQIIPSGEINFNQIVNDWGLTEVHETMQTIVSGILALLAIKYCWKIICIGLGIGTEIYDDYEDENEIINSEHQTINENTGISTISTTRRKGNKSVTIIGKATRKR